MARYESGEKNHPYRRGLVTEVDHDKRRVRVRFADEDANDSYWLRIPTRGGMANVEVDDYATGEMVDCLVDWDGEDGIVIGGSFNDKDVPPWTTPTKRGRRFEDGAEISHDTGTGTTAVTATTINLGPDGYTPVAGVGHMVHIAYGSSAGMHPIVTGSPSVNVKK